MTRTFFVPGCLVNPTNQRWHWSKRAKWAEGWRVAGQLYTLQEMGRSGFVGQVRRVHFACQVRRLFDSDNLVACVKPLRDGIAQALGVSDGARGGVEWTYSQDRHRDTWGVLVTVEDF